MFKKKNSFFLFNLASFNVEFIVKYDDYLLRFDI